VAPAEAVHRGRQQGRDLGLRQRQDPLEHRGGPRTGLWHLLAGQEQLDDHPPRIGMQPQRIPYGLAGGIHGFGSHGILGIRWPCWKVEMSAKVDSAPWLSLAPRGLSPSPLPPVAVSYSGVRLSLSPWNHATHIRTPLSHHRSPVRSYAL